MDKLDEDAKAWLDKFAKEYINASFNHKNPLHRTKKQRKEIYTRNNERNRCILTLQKAYGDLNYLEEGFVEPIHPEEADDGDEYLKEYVRRRLSEDD